ncbi:uncharacterized protein LOC106469361 [Limulus polyphemus]|uniref:Uncharacterized protein LOC106469361 n=1 Tax=Limulus polyphemus TaxID=6850 RepID=A0ABM1TF30_LIMPO|nr:uncharacterized protein LOC106469361 [Limulus polyphemus]
MMNTVSDDPISLWLRLGALEKLEQVLLDGYGEQLYGKTSRIPQVNKFLKQIPIFQAKIEDIHRAIAKGQLREVQHLIDRKKLAFSRDHMGASPLHKAVLYEQTDIMEYLLDRYNSVIHARDHQGRTPLHYAAVLKDDGKVYNMLLEAGADQKATDMHAHRPDYYIQNPNQLTLQQLKEGAVVNRIKKIKPKPQPKLVVNDSYRGFSAKPAGNRVQIKELIEQGSLENLEELLLQGHGDRLLGETSSNERIQEFLGMVPIYMERINEVHRAVVRGRIRDVQSLLDRKKLAVARDQLGATILHKAVMYGHFELAEYIVKNFPTCRDCKDVDGHTALHYAAVIPDEKQMYNMLVDAGVDTGIPDGKGKPAEYYLQYPEQFNLDQLIKRSQRVNATYVANNTNWFITKNPSGLIPVNGKSGTKRRLFTGIGPEKLLPEIQGEDGQIEEEGKNHLPQLFDRRNNYWTKPKLQRLEVTSANIRKWIQEEDLDKLEGAVLEGYGGKLSSVETSSEGVQNYINETVPKIMERIEAIHAAVAEGNVSELQNHLDKQDFVLAKDHMGMTPLHRAVILGHMDVVEYILDKFPETVNARDKDGRTALHYAAAVPRKDGKTMFKMLLQAGADTRIRDQRGRTPEYYRTHHLSDNSDHSKEQRGKTTSNQTEKEVKKGPPIPKAIIAKSNKALLDGDVAELQEIVGDGYGHYLISKTSWHENVRQYLKGLPGLLDLSIMVQQALKAGDLATLTEHVTNNEQLLCMKDENGEMLVHQAVVHNQFPILQFLVNQFPHVVRQRDRSGCTALHIAAKQKDEAAYEFLVSKEADPKALDQKGRTAEYYMKQGQKSEQILTKTSDANKQEPTVVSDTQIMGEDFLKGTEKTVVPIEQQGIGDTSDIIMVEKETTDNIKSISKETESSKAPEITLAEQDLSNIKQIAFTKQEASDTVDSVTENPEITYALHLNDEKQSIPTDAHETAQEESEAKDFQRLPLKVLLSKSEAKDTLEAVFEEHTESKEDNETDTKKTDENSALEVGPANESNDVQEVDFIEKFEVGDTVDTTATENPETTYTFDLNSEKQSLLIDAPETATEESEVKDALEAFSEEHPESIKNNELDAEKSEENGAPEVGSAEQESNDVQEVGFTEKFKVSDTDDTAATENLEPTNAFGLIAEEQPITIDAPETVLNESETKDTLEADSDETVDRAIENSEINDAFDLQPIPIDVPETALVESEGKETLEAALEEQPESNEVNEADIEKTEESVTLEEDHAEKKSIYDQEIDFIQQTETNDVVDTAIENPKSIDDFDSITDEQFKPIDALATTTEEPEAKDALEIVSEEQQQESNEVNDADTEESSALKADSVKPETFTVVSSDEQTDINSTSITGFEDQLKVKEFDEPAPETERLTDIPKEQEIYDEHEKDVEIKNSPTEKQATGDQSETGNSSEDFRLEAEPNENENNSDNTYNSENDDGSNKRNNTTEMSATSQDQYLNTLIEQWIQEGEMMRLEHVIIAGKGDRLIGKTSDNKDIQEFLDNVPTYMANIQAIHEAVVQGKLADVKQLLTRKRFALSRDQQGASPLHLAVLHGNFDVTAYITNTFPETLNGQDNEGRTPLHYAAIIPNGRKYYEILKEAGADDTINDRSGHSPQVYLDQPGLLTIRDLLESYKKGDSPQRSPSTVEVWHRPSIQEEEQELTPSQDENGALFQVEKTTTETIVHQILKEGSEDDKKYLVETVGNILTYGIREVDRLQPNDPIAYLATWLYSYASYKASKEKSVTRNDTTSHNKEDSMPEIEKALKEQTQNLRNQMKKIMTARSHERYENENSIDEVNNNDHSSFQFEDQTKMKDEAGQTVLHFAAMQSHQNDSFYNLIRQTEILLGERDENYNTVRDIAEQAGQWDNVQTLDQYIIDAFMSNNTDLLNMLMHEGYNHILNITDKGGKDLKTILEENKLQQSLTLLNELTDFEKKRNDLHNYIRNGYMEGVSNLINSDHSLVTAKNETARCSLHIAVLLENLDIVQKLVDVNSSSVHVPDNMGRTPLHYAMAAVNVTKIARILIEAGALRTTRDVKMQSVSHYYIEAEEIHKLKREEDQS